MNNSFEKVIANLNISLRNPIDRGEGEQPHCYIRADELAALIRCAVAIERMRNAGRFYDEPISAIEACDHD